MTGFLAGLALLVVGGEALVRGASRLAVAAGVSPLVVGLTVVSLGTSSPEVAVSVESALRGHPAMAVGNVVGSNVFNVLVILGLSALIVPLVVQAQLIRWDVPIMIGTSALPLVMAWDGRIGAGEGAILVAGAVAYTGFTIRMGRQAAGASSESAARSGAAGTWVWNAVLIALGIGLLVLGANTLIDAAIVIARSIGVSEAVIALTLVAAGTSLPEIATSLMAVVRGERDLAVGNVVGSNILNVLVVLGASAVVAPDGLPVSAATREFDLPVAVAVAAACLPIFTTGGTIARWEGALFLAYYAAYVVALYLDSSGHAAAGTYRAIMLLFVVPLTAVTLAVLAYRERARPCEPAR